jgi:dTDP-4-amino-4,6-dideoxygalactose transaminase
MISIFSNSLGKEELSALESVFDSKWLGASSKTLEFEKQFRELINSKYSLSYNCATAALYDSMRLIGIEEGDEVLITTINFIACTNAIIDNGGIPIFCDVDKNTLNILPEEISRKRTDKTKAVLLLHYGGHPCDMDKIYDVCDGLTIIEDSANSVYSSYKGKYCGTLGDIGCFSFDAMKILVTGDGGMMTFQNEKYYDKALSYRYLGLTDKDKSGVDSMKEGKDIWWEVVLAETAGRYVSNDIASTIGLEQLKKLNGFIERRKEIWDIYKSELSDIDWITLPPEPLDGCTSSYYLFWLQMEDRDNFARYMVDNDIYVTFRYYPLHLIKHYDSWDTQLPNAEFINDRTINIPLHQNLSDNDVEYIIKTIKKFK